MSVKVELKPAQECPGLVEIRGEAKILARAVDTADTVVITVAYWCLVCRVQETWGRDSTSQNLWQMSYIPPGALQKVALWWQMHESDHQFVSVYFYQGLEIGKWLLCENDSMFHSKLTLKEVCLFLKDVFLNTHISSFLSLRLVNKATDILWELNDWLLNIL